MAIIVATRMPRSRAISLSCAVASIFLPSMVFSKKKYWKTEQGQGADDDHDVLGVHEHSKNVQRGRRRSAAAWTTAPHRRSICAPFFRKMPTPMVLITTGRKLRFRNG